MRDLGFLILGMLIGTLPGWYARKRRLKTHWAVLRVEIELCKERAQTIIGRGADPLVLSPLFRLPLMAYQSTFPVLLTDGALNEDEANSLGRFYSQVQDINRGLDNAAEMYKSDNNRLFNEHGRNKLKSEGLFKEKDGEDSLYEKAKNIVDQKLSQKWWQYSSNA